MDSRRFQEAEFLSAVGPKRAGHRDLLRIEIEVAACTEGRRNAIEFRYVHAGFEGKGVREPLTRYVHAADEAGERQVMRIEIKLRTRALRIGAEGEVPRKASRQ